MAEIVKERTARKTHRCDRCRHRIKPGERYVDWRIPPGWDVNSSDHWWCGKTHVGNCLVRLPEAQEAP